MFDDMCDYNLKEIVDDTDKKDIQTIMSHPDMKSMRNMTIRNLI